MLLAEDLLLVLTDDETGQLVVSGPDVDVGLAGAILLELTLLGRADLSREGDPGKQGRVILRSHQPTGDDLLDHALGALGEAGAVKPTKAVTILGRDLRTRLYDRLTTSGILRAEKGRILGVIPTHRWPTQDASHEADVRRRLVAALTGEAATDNRTAALVALLHALKCEHKVIEPKSCGLSKRELSRRAEQIAQGGWASDAVRKVIDEMTAAVTVAVTAAAVVAATSS